MRAAFVNTMINLMERDENLIVLTADMGFSVFEEMQEKFPNRFINTGVTEQASVSVAAGMAQSGHKVFFYAQAPFATMRCFEQIRLDVAYNVADVKIVGVSSGFFSNQLGVSHFATEDVGLMRILPEMTIFTPGDPYEADWATKKAYELDSPCYIRLTKAGSDKIHKGPVLIEVGEMIHISKGRDATLFVSGSLLPMAMEIRDFLSRKKIEISVISVPTIKPLAQKVIIREAKRTGALFTLEDHTIIGGLGSAMAEVLVDENSPVIFHRFGLPDAFTKITGSVPFLLEHNGLSADKISSTIAKKLSKRD